MREHYPSKGAAWCAAQLGRSVSSTKWQAQQLGVRYTGLRSHIRDYHFQSKRPPEHYTLSKPCKECGENKAYAAYQWNKSNGNNYLRHTCIACVNRKNQENKSLKEAAPKLKTRADMAPCDNCYKAAHCRATGWACAAFDQFVETGRFTRAYIGMQAEREAA